jgi:hypothetical protein
MSMPLHATGIIRVPIMVLPEFRCVRLLTKFHGLCRTATVRRRTPIDLRRKHLVQCCMISSVRLAGISRVVTDRHVYLSNVLCSSVECYAQRD